MRRRNQKIGIVSYSSRKEEETLINKKRSSSNHKWEGRASAKKGAWRSFILPPQPASRLEKRNDKAKPELERSAAASRRHVDASLDLFARKSPRSLRDSAGKRALSARRLFFVDGGSIN